LLLSHDPEFLLHLVEIEALDQRLRSGVSRRGAPLDVYMALKQAATSCPVPGSRVARKISM